MNKFKWDAYKKEFPFLEGMDCLKDMDVKRLSRVSVKRLDRDVLARTPQSYYHDGSLGKSENFKTARFIIGGAVYELRAAPRSEWKSNYAHSQRVESPGETILEAIGRLVDEGGAMAVSGLTHIVWVEFDYSNWEGGTFLEKWEIEIFKLPRNELISAVLADANEQAAREVRAEANF